VDETGVVRDMGDGLERAHSCHATQLRRIVRRGTPFGQVDWTKATAFGQVDWTKATAAQLGLEDTLRPPGRRRKKSTMSKDTSSSPTLLA